MALHVQDCMKDTYGYAYVLRRMRTLAYKGETFDFSDWGMDPTSLTLLKEKELRALIQLHQLFYRERQKKISTLKKQAKQDKTEPLYEGITFRINQIRHRKSSDARDLTYRQVKTVFSLWQERKQTQEAAAASLGIHPDTFGRLARRCAITKQSTEDYATTRKQEKEQEYDAFIERINEMRRTRKRDSDYLTKEMFQEICNQWIAKKITKKQAAETIGISPTLLTRFFASQNIKQSPEPEAFKAIYAAWKRNEITTTEAARLSGLGETSFSQLVLAKDKKKLEEIEEKIQYGNIQQYEDAFEYECICTEEEYTDM